MSLEIERPTLEQIAALWEQRGGAPGQLPPLAGAGGAFVVPVTATEQGTGIEELAENKRLVDRLVGPQYQPQLRERWEFTGLRIPAVATIATGEAMPVPPVVTFTLYVMRNGDLVYTEQKEVASVTNVPATNKGFFANVLFSADLVNPFTLMQGQTLTLELAARMGKGKGLWHTVLSAEGSLVGEGVVINPPPPIIQQPEWHGFGVLYYTSQTLTGHRTL